MMDQQPARRDPDSSDDLLDQALVAQLQQLARASRPRLLSDLVGIFLRDTPPRLASLHESLEQGDTTRLEAVAHSLKGSSASLGAQAMSALCADLQATARAGTIERAAALVAAVEDTYSRTRPLLLALLADDGPAAG